MIKTKKQMFIVIGVFALVMMLGTVTFAFFNYTRTGVANTIRTGNISFASSQNGNINLTNVFPIARDDLDDDEGNSDKIVITISGDTSYTNGIEYLVTLEDVNIKTSTNKKIPVGIEITTEETGELGTEDTDEDIVDYFADRGGNTSYYKVLADEVIKDGEYVLVGYIAPGQTGVNGTIGIKAFIDKGKIAISDTHDGEESDNMGTTNNWVNGRTVLTTEEWNSLQGNNAISFKVRVQANEGVWVGEPLSQNDMANFNEYEAEIISSAQRSTITEINFIRMSEEMINTHSNLIDLTAENGQGVVKAWIDGTKLYIASPGETYFPEDSSRLFSNYSNVTAINFNNINTSQVTSMFSMFYNCSSLTNIDLSDFDTSSVTNMEVMFNDCTSLTNIDLSNFDTSNVTSMMAMFYGCSSLTNLDLSSFDTGKVEKMISMFRDCINLTSVNMSGLGGDNLSEVSGMFTQCTSLEEINMSGFNFGTSSMDRLFYQLTNLDSVNLTNANTSGVTSMSELFSGCTSLERIDVSGLGGNMLSNTNGMVANCTNLKYVNMSGFNFGTYPSLNGLFTGLSNLEEVDLSNAILDNNEGYMGLFMNSSKLKKVNLSGINVKSGSQFASAFSGCTALETIIVSNGADWSNLISQDYNMFNGCTSLVGGAGTSYDPSHIDASYAKVDGGEGNRGYFTASN